MKTTKMITLCGLGLFALMTLGANAQTNLLVNGGFEGAIGADNLPESWVNFGGQSAVNLSLVTTNPYEGLKSLSISYDPATNFDGLVTQTVGGIETGSKYEVSYWYKYSQVVLGSTAGSALQWLDVNNGDVSPTDEDSAFFFGQEAEPLAANVFLPLTVTVTAPPTATQLFIGITTSGPTRNFIIDDVKIVKSTTLGVNTFDVNTTKSPNVYTNDTTAYVATNGGEEVAVYNLLGQKIAGTKGSTRVTVLPNLKKNEVLIVRVDNKSTKIVLK
jgi:Carbohydrate binding domain